ncbi:MAG: phosphotransferase family protein [Rhizobiales bacterium]|nr:phosphotransferase family protein [Hyphomicrobiales bacterium]MBI3673502.1 phosphotransferase family protein [Hyphomicrobiales bacterium]
MHIDRQQAFSGTVAADISAAPLAEYLAARIDGFAGPLTVERFKGGQSNPSYLLSTPERRYVLRRKPFGRLLPSAHAIEREYRITLALSGAGFPVARPHLLCTDESIVGAPFYVMDHVAGRIFWEPCAPGLSAADRAAIFAALNATLARLHSLDYASLGLADFGRPEGYVARQIGRWSEQYRASESERIDDMDRLIAWLPGACPKATGAAIVHGDFRLDNCIVDQAGHRIVAVLDWELSTIGDPLADFTYHLMQWFMPVSETGSGVGSLIGHEADPGVPALDDYVAVYARATGRAAIPDLNVYMAYNFFRLAAILQGILGRVRDGTAANTHAAAMARQVRPLAATAWVFARKAGA